MATATPETIRNRVAALIEALTPTSDSGTRFHQSRDEAAADFPTWAESAPTACLRRFQVQESEEGSPLTSSVDVTLNPLTLVVRIAYATTHRFGGGRDRDDVIKEDWRKIDQAIGTRGRANYSGTNDCTPMTCRMDIDRTSNKVHYLVITIEYTYTLDVDG